MTSTVPASMGEPLSEAERRRNQHCMNCGDTRGGPVGHETSECTYDSAAGAVRAALRPGFKLTLSRLILAAQQDTYPLADADDSGGPYIVDGCVVYGAKQLTDALRTVWKYTPQLLDELEATKKANLVLEQGTILAVEARDAVAAERDRLAEQVRVLEGQLATARKQQLCTVVGAYVAWEIDNAKRNDLPITHSIADGSEGKLRGAMATFQELLVALGEIEGDEDLEEVWAVVEAEMKSERPLGLDGGGSDAE